MSTAILYTRVSTSAQEREGTSLDSQLLACRRYADDRKYKVVRSISESFSGAELWDRPGINEARELIRRKKAKVLVAYAIDRLSRNPAHLLILLEEASRYDVRIEFVTEQMEDSPEWKLIQYVKSYAAELEREKIRERSVRGKHQRVASGKLHRSSTELYGYIRNHEVNRREIVEAEARIVRQIFDRALEGHSLISIANELNTAGIAPPSAGKREFKNGREAIWNPSALHRILREPSYRGEARGWRWKHHKQVVIERPAAEQVIFPEGTCPAIVTPETWHEALRKSQANRGAITRNEKRFVLLRELATCANCGRTLTADQYLYRCNSRKLVARHCGSRGVQREPLETWVWSQVEAILKDPEELARRIARDEKKHAKELAAEHRKIAEAKARLIAIDRATERLLRTFAAGDDTYLASLSEKQIRELQSEKKWLRERLTTLEKPIDRSSETVRRILALVDQCRRSPLPQSPTERRKVLEMLGAEVVADRENWSLSIKLNSHLEPRSNHAHGMNEVPRWHVAMRAA